MDQAGDARTGDDLDVFNAHEGQFLENCLARIKFLFAQFRMGMEILAHFHHIRQGLAHCFVNIKCRCVSIVHRTVPLY